MRYRFGQSLWMLLSLLAMMVMHVHPSFGQLVPDDEKRIRWPADEAASRFRRPVGPAPVTVATKDPNTEERYLPLDEAIQLALSHSEVIRVLSGTTATSSGQTIYDTAIAVSRIDVEKATFDPVFKANSSFLRKERPSLKAFPAVPVDRIDGTVSGGNQSDVGLTDKNQLGGTSGIKADYTLESHELGSGWDYQNTPGLEVSYTQPLLAGAGLAVNRAPIVIARLQQQQSYFQFKEDIQRLVNDVIEGYWALVQARTALWASEIRLEQLQFSYDRVAARVRVGLDAQDAQEAQAKSTLANAKADQIQAAANVLQLESALRNLLGLPPEDGTRLVPSTPPTRDRVEFRWNEIVEAAQLKRPDLIELNLVLMADQQQLIENRNGAQPSLGATAMHRWNGIQGRTAATGQNLNTPFDNHTDWTLGVTFEVPISLRKARAELRSTELKIAKDRANIQQFTHQVEHELASTLRKVDLSLEQYEAFREAREAARRNVNAQRARVGPLANLLSELQAISDWATAVSSESQALATYNTELANLEQQTGTILETHGVRFVEERFASIGPHGRHYDDECYPRNLRPTDPAARYEDSQKPAEEAFDLKDTPKRSRADSSATERQSMDRSEDPSVDQAPAAELPTPSSRGEYDPIPQ